MSRALKRSNIVAELNPRFSVSRAFLPAILVGLRPHPSQNVSRALKRNAVISRSDSLGGRFWRAAILEQALRVP